MLDLGVLCRNRVLEKGIGSGYRVQGTGYRVQGIADRVSLVLSIFQMCYVYP